LSSPISAAGPLFTGGIVNVTVTDVIDDVTVVVKDVNVGLGVPPGIAVNTCADANVAAVLAPIRDTGDFTCEQAADAGDQVVEITQD